ncbi:MAG: hypothetical protein KGD64_12580 [Candidatus Heimdallarchaeota archaeon]|nr:hypothetical protein [Candidatus Heimdallarchaeota archaeon]
MDSNKRKPKYINQDGYEVYQNEDGKDYVVIPYDEFELQSKGPEAYTGNEWKRYYTEWKEGYPLDKLNSYEYKRICQLFELFIEKTEKKEKN